MLEQIHVYTMHPFDSGSQHKLQSIWLDLSSRALAIIDFMNQGSQLHTHVAIIKECCARPAKSKCSD